MIEHEDIVNFTSGGCLEFAFAAKKSKLLKDGEIVVAVDYGLSPPAALHAMVKCGGNYFDIFSRNGVENPIEYIILLSNQVAGHLPNEEDLELEEYDSTDSNHFLPRKPKLKKRAEELAKHIWG